MMKENKNLSMPSLQTLLSTYFYEFWCFPNSAENVDFLWDPGKKKQMYSSRIVAITSLFYNFYLFFIFTEKVSTLLFYQYLPHR